MKSKGDSLGIMNSYKRQLLVRFHVNKSQSTILASSIVYDLVVYYELFKGLT